jgi:hypothetical protein
LHFISLKHFKVTLIYLLEDTMSVAVSQMPALAPSSHLHRSNNSSINPLAAPFKPSGTIIQPAANGTSVRRLSTGAALAEAVGIDLNAIGRGMYTFSRILSKTGG